MTSMLSSGRIRFLRLRLNPSTPPEKARGPVTWNRVCEEGRSNVASELGYTVGCSFFLAM
jgi:hypothetical protein